MNESQIYFSVFIARDSIMNKNFPVVSTSVVLFALIHCCCLAQDDWRGKKIAEYNKRHHGRLVDADGNPKGRIHDLGGASKLQGKITILDLTSDSEEVVADDSFLLEALKRRIEVEVLGELPSSPNRLAEQIRDSTQLWIWAGTFDSCLPEEYLSIILTKIQSGTSLFLLADNTPYTKGVDRILSEIVPDSFIAGNYRGTQMLHQSSSGPGFDGKHPLFQGINTLYEGVTVSSITGSGLTTVARSSDGNPLICIAQTQSGGGVIISGGFTAFLNMFWETAGTERLALNAAAFLSGLNN
jgi:hypothetical protein